MLNIADEYFRLRKEFLDFLASFLGADDKDQVGSGFKQCFSDESGNAFFVCHTEDHHAAALEHQIVGHPNSASL
jgi:hypothetical protein